MRAFNNSVQLYSVAHSAKLLHLSEYTIWRLIKARRLSVVRIRGRVLISANALDRLIRRHTFGSTYDNCNTSEICFQS